MPFADHLDGLDAAVAEHLCDSGRLLRAAAVLADPVSVIVERASGVSPMLDARGIVRDKPIVRLSFAEVASLMKGDVVEAEGRGWRIVGAPSRPDDGRWWLADVDDLGPLA